VSKDVLDDDVHTTMTCTYSLEDVHCNLL